MNKVYLMYLGKELYAWTRDKKLRDQFINFRTHEFHIFKHELDIEEYQEFAEKYNSSELMESTIQIDGNPYKIAMTKNEDGHFNGYLDTIVYSYSDAIERLKMTDDKKLYEILTEIDPILQTIEDPHSSEKLVCATVDMKEIDIFYDMFPDTF